jgi:hypothetical protein
MSEPLPTDNNQIACVRPAEMARIRENNPDLVGIPTYYSIEDDDVQWWPSCTEGWPVLGYDRP